MVYGRAHGGLIDHASLITIPVDLLGYIAKLVSVMQYVIQKALYTGMLSIYSTPMTTVVDKRARTSLKLKPGATIMQLRNRLLMLCEDKDYDPIEEMINLVKEGYKVKGIEN